MCERMTPLAAAHVILGDKCARAIFLDMGEAWTIIAAVTYAQEGDDPEALAVLKAHCDKQKAEQATS